jgi:U5 small nuclear ribonucleoprotein component
MMEPVALAEVLCPLDCIQSVQDLLLRRRAHEIKVEPVLGTPLHRILLEIPIIESFGFETDLRTYTLG